MMQDLMQRISLRELRLLLLGLGAVVTALMVVTVVVPRVKALAAVNREAAVLEDAAADGAELERHVTEQHAKIEDLKYRLHGDMANLPVKQAEAFIIGRLQRVSWSNEVELVSVEPTFGDRVKIFQEILFNVELVGQYGDLYRWLWDARNELGYVVIKEFRLTRQDDDDEDPRLRAELSLASYRAME